MAHLLTCKALIVLLLVLAVGAGALAIRESTVTAPASIKPSLNADGSYLVGTVGTADDRAAVAAAVAALPVALSYDYRTLDKSLSASTALMTSGFGAEFRKTFDATTRRMAVDKQAITSALVRGAGIVGSASGGSATVLIYLDQVLVSSKDKRPNDPLKVSQNRVHVTLRHVGGGWQISGIEPF